MIATIIAYSMAATCAFISFGLLIFSFVNGEKLSGNQIVASIFLFLVFGSLSWGFAYLGGLS